MEQKRPLSIFVKLQSGEKILRKNAVRINKVWFRKDDENIIFINDQPYLKNSKEVYFDHETKEYCLQENRNGLVTIGVVDIKVSNSGIEYVRGYFTRNNLKNARIFCPDNGNSELLIDVEIIKNNFLFSFYPFFDVYCEKRLSNTLQHYVRPVDYKRKGYSIEDNAREYSEKIQSYNTFKTPINKNIGPFAALLGKDLSFGMEVETIAGKVEDYILYRAGTVICRDGSLTNGNDIGAEYVTVPMKGLKGLSNIQYILTEIQKVSKIDLKCSLHFHFGGFNTDKYFLISLYKLCLLIQDDLFKMFPYYKTNPEGVKNKNYNKKFINIFRGIKLQDKKDIDPLYISLFKFLSGGVSPEPRYNRRTGSHPAGSKWNIESRYYWVNFNNAIFSKRNTIEFRLHTPTMNYMKAIIWLFICNAIIRFAEKHQSDLLSNKKFTLYDVFDYYADKSGVGKFVSGYLKAYYEHKRDIFQKDFEKRDFISMHDIEKDHEFKFKYGNISYWF